MKIPPNMTEDEVVSVIERVACNLATRFKFGYHETEDMKQQARLYAIQGLDGYDNERPLENFLWTHVRNRLCNFKRDNYSRPNKPCLDCPWNAYRSDHTCSKFNNMMDCHLYEGWAKRNISKKNLLVPITIDGVRCDNEANMYTKLSSIDNLIKGEMVRLLEDTLPLEYRHDWLKLLGGVRLPKNRKFKLIQKILEILGENNYDVSTAQKRCS